MTMKLSIFCSLIIVLEWTLPAPGQNTLIFPGLNGQELLDSLIANYRTAQVLTYGEARDTLFRNIDRHDDSLLTCVYTGYTISLPDTVDPTSWAYDRGIDTEHTWPQANGAVGQARSDMYHLYPTRREANSARGNDPFAEIPDPDTDRWYRLTQMLTTIPTSFMEEYSEKDLDLSRFEPREDHKGNVARSMFYFYTMYRHEADSADPAFFPLQKEVLYHWHGADPVDSRELNRDELISHYQGGYHNPYILDSTLVRRAFFSQPAGTGKETVNPSLNFVLFPNYPNPFNANTDIRIRNPQSEYVTVKVYNVQGEEIATLYSGQLLPGFHKFRWDATPFPAGIYFCRIRAGGFFHSQKMIYIR